jgi:hypothetical protein
VEDETMIACGSDHGLIYTFSVGTTKCLQKIKHGSYRSLVQVLAVCISSFLYLLSDELSGFYNKRTISHCGWDR